MPKYHSLRGMPDILPDDTGLFQMVERKAREVFDVFEFFEIRTPIIEETDVFTRSIGADTDIVEKEMYSFTDRGGRNISLRPEGTASVVRAYIEHGMHNSGDISRLFYIGPMFRAERPQKGRLRQFHQIGAEIIGSSSSVIDAELILNVKSVLENIGISGMVIHLNTLGCASDRRGYRKVLKGFLAGEKSSLCENCRRRSSANVLRVLDCKNESCREVIARAPRISESLCQKCKNDHDDLLGMLKTAGVDVNRKPDLVRGLDYYTGMVFEISHPSLGAQDAIAAGGRYDDLIKQMGGPDKGATGYSIGIERLVIALGKSSVHASRGVLVVAVDEASRGEAFITAARLREAGVICSMESSGRSLKSALRLADKEERRYVVIIGEDERAKGTYLLKDMENGEQLSLPFDEIMKKCKH